MARNKQRIVFLNIFFWAIGIAIISYMVLQIGPHILLKKISAAGWSLLLLCFLPILWFIAHAQGTRYTLNDHNKKNISLFKMTLIQTIGYGISWSQPLQGVVGEPTKLLFLDKQTHDKEDFTASLLIDNTINFFANAITSFTAMLLVISSSASTSAMRYATAFFLLFTLIILAILIKIQKNGVFTKTGRFLQKFRFTKKLIENNKKSLIKIDHTIRNFYSHRRADFFRALFFHILERLHGVFEFFLIFSIVGQPTTLWQCLSIYGIVNGLDNILFFLQIGGMESYTALILKGLGNNIRTINFTVPLFRRIRILFWVVVAFLLLKPVKKCLQNRTSPDIVIPE